MDNFYDQAGAAALLEDFASSRHEALSNRDDQSVAHLADIKVDQLSVVETGHQRKDWRLCSALAADSDPQEIVVRLQGIMTKNNLVPKNANACSKQKVTFLSQHIELCGFGTYTFDQSLAKIPTIVDRFEQHLAGAELGSIPEAEGAGGRLFSASNRLFTIKSDAPTEQDTEFQLGVDPFNILGRLKGNSLIHAPQNIVKFYKRDERDSVVTYWECTPGIFKPGDVVEVQVSFVALSAPKGRVKVTTRLQAVTLLSSEFSKRAREAKQNSTVHSKVAIGTRRRVGYFNEDDEDERQIKKRRTEASAGDEMEH